MRLILGPTEVVLLPDRAVFLPQSRTLVVADLHLGKSATFRTRGLPVPEGTTSDDLARLSALLGQTRAETLVVAGDLIHARDGLTESLVASFRVWLESHRVRVILTEGNHDRGSGAIRATFPIETCDHFELNGLIITHDPDDLSADEPGIAGHLHPGIRIRESRLSSLRFPAFHLRPSHHLILPAFSGFTGLKVIDPSPCDRFFVSLDEAVVEIPPSLIRSAL